MNLPFEQDVNAFVTQAYEHRTFFTRLHQFVLMSDAFIVVPGGIGTVLEAMMIWQLLQVHHIEGTPLILTGKMYQDLVAWCRNHMLRPEFPLASAEDIALPQCVDDSEGILRIIREHHAGWLTTRNKLSGPIRPTLLWKNCFLRRNSFLTAMHLWFAAEPVARASARYSRFTVRRQVRRSVKRLRTRQNRMRFLGRGGTPAEPAALALGFRLSRTTGPVLDPIFSLRRRVSLEAGMTTRIAFVTGATATREAAIGITERFGTMEAIDEAFASAKAYCPSAIQELELAPGEIDLFNRLAAYVIFANSGLRDRDAAVGQRLGQASLWPVRHFRGPANRLDQSRST